MIKTISRTNDTILVVDDSGVKTARADHPKWTEICELYNRISYDTIAGTFYGPTLELLDAMDMKTAVETYTVGLLSVNPIGVTYAGRPIHTIDAERLMAFMRDKLSYKPIANYIARKMKNPSPRAIKEMYNFLEHKGMPLTLRGTFIAYKGVATDFWSIRGNKDTVVLQGEVNAKGQILNTIGATIEVERSSVDDDFRQACGAGLHVGSLSYAKGWGQQVILVEVDPADVVSVPDDCSCQKLRCCKYTVVGEYSGPMPDTLTTEFDSTDDEDDICHQCGQDLDDCECDDEDNDAERESETPPKCPATAMEDDCNCEQCNHVLRMDVKPALPPSTMSLFAVDDTEKATVNVPPSVVVNVPLNSNVYVRVIDIIIEQLGLFGEIADSLNSNTVVNYETLGMDSLDGVELCMAFEEEFEIEIADELVEKYINRTIGEIVQSVENFLKGKLDAKADCQHQRQPAWRYGDWNGADSLSHMAYIYGYVAAFNGL